jgi:NADH dehydrogenase (ubiquinone) 1 alpha subcomplex subunit 8
MSEQQSAASVEEIKATHAPLLSAAYFINEHCKDYNDDFMLCKRDESMDPAKCALEGRKVTRCAIDLYVGFRLKISERVFFWSIWFCLDWAIGESQIFS